MYQAQQLVPLQATLRPVQPAQIDISGLINQIIPIFTLMLVFGMLLPMFKQMGRVFE